MPAVGARSSGEQKLPIPVRKPQGCTCQAGGTAAASSVVLALGAVGLVLRRRRRR